MIMEKLGKIRSKIPTIILTICLLAIVIMTGFNIYITFQYNQKLADLGFQDSIFNSTSVIVAKANATNLGKPATYLISDSLVHETVHYGTLYAHVQILNSHYGSLTLSLQFFHGTSSGYLDADRLNQTKVSFADQNASQTFILAPGLNQVNPELELKAEIYPNSEMFPSAGESVQLLLGTLTVKAEFFDFDTEAKTSSVFSSNVIVTFENPQ